MASRRFVTNVVAVLLFAASVNGSRNDLVTAAKDTVTLVTDHPVNAFLVLVAVVLLGGQVPGRGVTADGVSRSE